MEKFSILCFHKINVFSIAAVLGKSGALSLASKEFGMWIGEDDKTLIEICGQTNDSDCIDICLKKIASGQGNMNRQSLSLVITSDETDNVKDVLTNHQIKEAEFNSKASNLLPLKGKIKRDSW